MKPESANCVLKLWKNAFLSRSASSNLLKLDGKMRWQKKTGWQNN